MGRDRETWAAYMRDYRRRKRDGLPLRGRLAKTNDHLACDVAIAERDAKIRGLEIENQRLRELLPF